VDVILFWDLCVGTYLCVESPPYLVLLPWRLTANLNRTCTRASKGTATLGKGQGPAIRIAEENHGDHERQCSAI
jgi:hypothetical protein